MSKRILINVTNTIPVKSTRGSYIPGIGQATIALVNALCKLDNLPYEIKLYATGLRSLQFDFYNWTLPHCILPSPNRIKIGGRQLDSYLRPSLLKYDLFHITENYFDVAPKEPFMVTIHDCTELDPNLSMDIDDHSREILIPKYKLMAEKSEIIVTDSMASKEDIVNYLKVSPEKVFVNHLGIDRNRFKRISERELKNVLNKFGITSPYFFACSCNRSHKNLLTALRAFKRFTTYSPKHIFLAVWRTPSSDILQEFAAEIESRKIIFLPFLSDEEIVAFYNGASLSVYVSRKEGFGMPILESFACGTPVMTCQNSSLPEVGQDAAIYVGEDDIDEMVDVMKIFENELYNLNTFKIQSENILNQFSWRETALRCLKIYDKCFNS